MTVISMVTNLVTLYPSVLHMTVESMPVNSLSQMEPHSPFEWISMYPELLELPFASLISDKQTNINVRIIVDLSRTIQFCIRNIR